MKIYTRGGDAGTTSLFNGERVAKSHPRVMAYGSIDELNSHLGLARSFAPALPVDQILERLQRLLFTVGADLATPQGGREVTRISDQDVAGLEQEIDHVQEHLPPLKSFILPGGTQAAAAIHLARCVCRKAEREALQLSVGEVGQPVLILLNRLSDYLFVLARFENHLASVEEIPAIPKPVNP
ncbi:MAG: cob(I)yrinic acid a,c-diamide adenosyltransferase [Terrimicrobiaceae bacterium]